MVTCKSTANGIYLLRQITCRIFVYMSLRIHAYSCMSNNHATFVLLLQIFLKVAEDTGVDAEISGKTDVHARNMCYFLFWWHAILTASPASNPLNADICCFPSIWCHLNVSVSCLHDRPGAFPYRFVTAVLQFGTSGHYMHHFQHGTSVTSGLRA